MTANGKILAIRIKDGQTGTWYEWDKGVGWRSQPVAHAGVNMYIAVYVTSATIGKVTIKVSANNQTTYFRVANIAVSPSSPAGCEGNWTMPNDVSSQILVTVSDVA